MDVEILLVKRLVYQMFKSWRAEVLWVNMNDDTKKGLGWRSRKLGLKKSNDECLEKFF